MFTSDRTTFHGTAYDVVDAPCEPKPVQAPLPILVGTKSPRMLRITARHAQEWNTWGTPEAAGEALEALLAACDAVGRDPQTMRKTVNVALDLDGEHPAGRTPSLTGSAQALVDQMGRYVELGFDEFIMPDWNLGHDTAERADNLTKVRTEVLEKI